MIDRTQPQGNRRRARVRLPEYGRVVWGKWLLLTVFALVPGGALLGILFGDPANGEWDTAFAWGSTRELLLAVGVGVWLCVFPGTAIYFERVNTRYRSELGDVGQGKSPGFGAAITALALAFFLPPLGAVFGWAAMGRISSSGVRYARGRATALTAYAAAVGGLVVMGLALAGSDTAAELTVFPGPNADSNSRSAPAPSLARERRRPPAVALTISFPPSDAAPPPPASLSQTNSAFVADAASRVHPGRVLDVSCDEQSRCEVSLVAPSACERWSSRGFDGHARPRVLGPC